jgi:alginate O-acetyltransferase complex protein AlgI
VGLSDLNFLFRFLPVFLLLYILCPLRYRNGLLLIASLIFCGLGSVKGMAVLLGSLTVNYILLRVMDLKSSSFWRRTFLSLAVFFQAALLSYYKFAASALPPGISFYTFTLLSADFDIYHKREMPARSWLEFGAYTAMFPKLISGPITKYHDTIHQFRRSETSGKRVEYGLSLLIAGLSFKVLIADTLGILWHDIQTVGFESISTPLAWMGAAAYSVQLLFDFQGYSLMALGLGYMLGFELPKNFDHPYRSGSISEYYRRWHISLGQWFRDYLYIPLGGSRMGSLRTAFNLLTVWIVTGIWHGVTPNFLLWGLILGFFIILEKFCLGSFLSRHTLLSHLYVWFLIPLTWVIFAITDLRSLGFYFSRLFPFWGGGIAVNAGDWLRYGRTYIGFFLAALAVSLPAADRLWIKYWHTLPAKGLLFALFWVCVYRIVNGLHNPFMYFSF